MVDRYIIGFDFGTGSARGVLLDADSGTLVDHAIEPYPHGILAKSLPSGEALTSGSALHHPHDYLEVAKIILRRLGRDRHIVAIGIASTASSPLSTRADGSTFIEEAPDDPSSYVKLWKHSKAQKFADEINMNQSMRIEGPSYRISGESLFAKAAETRTESPFIWRHADKFIEVGDWIVWQLTGNECRSMDFACFKAMYSSDSGYPSHLVEGLEPKLSKPNTVGRSAGFLSGAWMAEVGLSVQPVVSVACIDSHAVLPAVGVASASTIVGVLGTSSGFLILQSEPGAVPLGYEGGAFNAALPDLWCCEAGQAGFGDMLAWFVKTFPSPDNSNAFEWYNERAIQLEPGQGGLLALDWFNGNRVPYADSSLRGLLLGLHVGTTPVEIYRALVEALAFGIRNIIERGEASGISIDRVVLTSAPARNNTFLLQTICDVLGRVISVPRLDHATAVGAAIHGAVACGIVSSFDDGSARFATKQHVTFSPEVSRSRTYDELYTNYLTLSSDQDVIRTMRKLASATVARSTAAQEGGS